MAVTIPVQNATEIHAAMTGLVPGDTLLMLDGVWIDQYIALHAEGTEADPIVLIAETPGQVVLTGLSRLALSGSYVEVNGLNFFEGYTTGAGVIEFRRNGVRANHCRVTNTTIFAYNPTNIGINYKWVSMYGRFNQVDHCYFAGKNHDGATFVVWLPEEQDRDNHHVIEYNYFGYRPPLGFNGGETIRIGDSGTSMTNSRTVVRHNLFQECDGEIEIISNKSCENIYFNNTFVDNEGTLTLRHGERCLVEGNFFLGAGNSEAGGVRIIDSDHIIINNYFQDLYSNGYRSAITFIKGVQDSPPERYLQVENVLVAYNTLINCRQSFLLGYGTSDDQTLPPINCTIANNAVYTKNYSVFYTGDTEGLPQGFIYKQNMVKGTSLGIPDTSAGIIWQDPLFDFTSSGLIRPTPGSPLIGQAAELGYNVSMDMDGHDRGSLPDIGADQVSSDPIIYRPLTREDVGPGWDFQPPDNQIVEGGLNTLVEAVEKLIPGDTLFLVGADYEFSEPVVIERDVIILPGPGMGMAPIVLRPASSGTGLSALFDIRGRSKLKISGLTIDGGGVTGNTIQRIFHANYDNSSLIYTVDVEGVTFKNIGKAGDYATLLEANAGTLADSLKFRNCQVSHVNGTIFILDNPAVDSGEFSARSVILENCTFWDVSKSVLSIYGGDSNPFSAGPVVEVNHCTFHACGSADYTTIDAKDVDVATIRNSIFTSSSLGGKIVDLYSWSQIHHCDVFESGSVGLNGSASSGVGILEVDPGYVDASAGNFLLGQNSLLYSHPGDDGLIYGDQRWHDPRYLAIDTHAQPQYHQNICAYPNPFNGSTSIQFEMQEAADVRISLINLRGREIQEISLSHYAQGQHQLQLDLEDLHSGVYVCRIESAGLNMMTKLTVLK